MENDNNEECYDRGEANETNLSDGQHDESTAAVLPSDGWFVVRKHCRALRRVYLAFYYIIILLITLVII